MAVLPPPLAQATLEAVGSLLRDVGRQLLALPAEVSDKPGVDLVTQADLHSERAITAALHQQFPHHRILAEEGTRLGPTDSGWTWHLDPLDGTGNFSRGIPYWGISAGLAHGDTPVLGIVHAPAMELTASAAVGHGAWSGARPLPRAAPAGPLRTWIVATDWPWDLGERRRTNALLDRLAPRIRQYKTFGSAALDLVQLATGHVDAYANSHVFPWDLAGGAALLQTLGFELRRWDGTPWDLRFRDLVACRPGMWDELGPLCVAAWQTPT